MAGPHQPEDVHPSYSWQRDNSLPDVFLSVNHFYIDIVLGNNLITALKDEGAANLFITVGLVKACGSEPRHFFILGADVFHEERIYKIG